MWHNWRRCIYFGGSSSPNANPNWASIEPKLAGWPVLLTATTFDRLHQYARSPGCMARVLQNVIAVWKLEFVSKVWLPWCWEWCYWNSVIGNVCWTGHCREQYSEILRKRWVEVFNRIFDEDNYTAISVETADEYDRIASVYPFRDAALEQVQLANLGDVLLANTTAKSPTLSGWHLVSRSSH